MERNYCHSFCGEPRMYLSRINSRTENHHFPFFNFLMQAARETNLALSVAQNASCRHDYFQLPGQLTVSIYAKATIPNTVVVEANQTRLFVRFDFGQERQHFERTFDLFGVRFLLSINCEGSWRFRE